MNWNLGSALQIPKELQFYLKNKAKGYTDEMDYMRLEKEMAANKMSIDRVLQESAHRCEEIQVKYLWPTLRRTFFVILRQIVWLYVHLLTELIYVGENQWIGNCNG